MTKAEKVELVQWVYERGYVSAEQAKEILLSSGSGDDIECQVKKYMGEIRKHVEKALNSPVIVPESAALFPTLEESSIIKCEFKPGDTAHIKPQLQTFYGNYSDTDVKILQILGKNASVEAYDGTKHFVCLEHLESIKDAEKKKDPTDWLYYTPPSHSMWDINTDAEPPPVPEPCLHPNKYKNIISSNLKFWVCPDCKADLGDVVE